MWEPGGPWSDLRQGDLVADVRVPVIELPPTVVGTEGAESAADAVLQVRSRVTSCLVVTQCCSVERALSEKGSSISLAPIRLHKPHGLGVDDYFRSVEDGGDLGGYPTEMHGVRPLDGVIDDRDGYVNGADLTRTFSVKGDIASELIHRIRGRMTVLERQRLRDRLMLFWGRTPEEDRSADD